MNKVLYFVSMGILVAWILKGESLALNDEDMQLMALSDSASFSHQILAQVPDSPSSDSQSQSTIPSVQVPEKSNTVANLIQSTDPEEREKVLQQNLGNEVVDDSTVQPSETISVPRGRDPFSIIPEIPVPEELAPEESSVAQLPEIQGQQLPGLPTLPETTAPTTWRRNVRRVVPSDDSLIVAQQRRRRPLPNASPFENSFVEHGC